MAQKCVCGTTQECGCYTCCNCGTKVELDKTEVLPPCPRCGNPTFTCDCNSKNE